MDERLIVTSDAQVVNLASLIDQMAVARFSRGQDGKPLALVTTLAGSHIELDGKAAEEFYKATKDRLPADRRQNLEQAIAEQPGAGERRTASREETAAQR